MTAAADPFSNSASFFPEKRLLIECARSRFLPANVDAIRSLVEAGPDWTCVFAEASQNSVTPLLAWSLCQVAADVAPSQILDKLKEENRAHAIRCLYLSAELARLLEIFQAESILAVPYKGPITACQAYGDVTLRAFDDLDIIAEHKDAPRVHELLLAQGYKPRFPWIFTQDSASRLIPGEYNYCDKTCRIMVELHTERTLRHFPRPADIRALTEPLVALEVAGKQVSTFSPEVALLLLCLHGSKDFWGRLLWIADVSAMVSSHPDLNWDEVHRHAESAGCSRMLCLGLQLAVDTFGVEIPRLVRDRLEADRIAGELARSACARLLDPSSARLSAFDRFRFRRLLVPGFVPGTRYSLRLTLAPSEDDWEAFPLPALLSSIYPLLRPLRLLRKYGIKARPGGSVSRRSDRQR